MNGMEKALMKDVTGLVERSRFVVVCSVGEGAYPAAKAMINMEHDGLGTFYLSTNLSSRRAQCFLKDHRACLYFHDMDFHGLMLTGDMEVRTDRELRERLWREGNEIYYPTGVDDPDYCVLKFTIKTGNYYHGLKNVDFEL